MPEIASNPPSTLQVDMARDHILVVDDDRAFSELISEYLAREGFQVECVSNGKHGLERTLSGKFDIVVLDLVTSARSAYHFSLHASDPTDPDGYNAKALRPSASIV